MAEKVEEQVVAQSEGDGKKVAPKSNEQIGEEKTVDLISIRKTLQQHIQNKLL